jgi:opacity protein-like surface antigen
VKQLLLILLFISSLYADAKIYLGVSGGAYSEDFRNLDASSSAELVTLKVGYGIREAYAVEFSVDYATNNSKIFSSSSNVSSDGDKIGFNVSLMKAFDFGIYVLPFVKVGFGVGYLAIEREIQDSLSYGSFQGTLGVFLPLDEHSDIELGYEAKSNSYEYIDAIATKTSYDSTIHTAYIGVNYRF